MKMKILKRPVAEAIKIKMPAIVTVGDASIYNVFLAEKPSLFFLWSLKILCSNVRIIE